MTFPRGHDASHNPDVPRSRPFFQPARLGTAISELVALRGLAQQRGDAQLASQWATAAGERIASRTHVIGLQRGVLHVAVTSSAMLNELASFHRHNLVQAMRKQDARLKLRDIKFRLRGDLNNPTTDPA